MGWPENDKKDQLLEDPGNSRGTCDGGARWAGTPQWLRSRRKLERRRTLFEMIKGVEQEYRQGSEEGSWCWI